MDNNEIILPDTSKLIVSSSPHVLANDNVTGIMRDVIIALLPACILGVVFFGISAFNVLLLCTLFCVGLEAVALKALGKDLTALKDGSALVTGILLGMNLASNTPWWVCLIGAGLAIVLAKHLYGGLGYNPFNPALVGRVGLLIAFPTYLTTWPVNRFSEKAAEMKAAVADILSGDVTPQMVENMGTFTTEQFAAIKATVLNKTALVVDAVSSATPLDVVSHATTTLDPVTGETVGPVMYYMNYFLGGIGGCIGETSALALIIGGLYLIYRGLIRWQVPFFYILTVVAITGTMYMINPDHNATPLFHILTGGMMLGAFFMATDMVTSPVTKKGSIIFAIGCGVITSVIRIWGSYPEGVSFSILFMNAFVPLIDRISSKTVFGTEAKKGGVA